MIIMLSRVLAAVFMMKNVDPILDKVLTPACVYIGQETTDHRYGLATRNRVVAWRPKESVSDDFINRKHKVHFFATFRRCAHGYCGYPLLIESSGLVNDWRRIRDLQRSWVPTLCFVLTRQTRLPLSYTPIVPGRGGRRVINWGA